MEYNLSLEVNDNFLDHDFIHNGNIFEIDELDGILCMKFDIESEIQQRNGSDIIENSDNDFSGNDNVIATEKSKRRTVNISILRKNVAKNKELKVANIIEYLLIHCYQNV